MPPKPKYKIQFTRNYLVKDDSGTQYEPGDILDCDEPSMWHFLRRGVAVRVTDDSKVTGSTGQPEPDPDALRGLDLSSQEPPEPTEAAPRSLLSEAASKE